MHSKYSNRAEHFSIPLDCGNPFFNPHKQLWATRNLTIFAANAVTMLLAYVGMFIFTGQWYSLYAWLLLQSLYSDYMRSSFFPGCLSTVVAEVTLFFTIFNFTFTNQVPVPHAEQCVLQLQTSITELFYNNLWIVALHANKHKKWSKKHGGFWFKVFFFPFFPILFPLRLIVFQDFNKCVFCTACWCQNLPKRKLFAFALR